VTPLETLTLPVVELTEVSLLGALLNYPPVKALLPLPILVVIAPALWWFFRDTWRLLDRERAAAIALAPGSESQPGFQMSDVGEVTVTLQGH